MKLNSVLIFLCLLSLSCSKEESVITNQQEDSIITKQQYELNKKSIDVDSTKYSYNDLFKSPNPYNNLGNDYYQFLSTLKSKIDSKDINTQNDLDNYLINNNISQFVNDSLNKTEEDLLDKLVIDLNSDNSITKIIELEQQIFDENKTISCENLLKTVSVLKFGLYFNTYSTQGLSGDDPDEPISSTCYRGDECFDICLCEKAHELSNSNLVDQVSFILTAGESFALWVASCAWDCAF